MGQCTGRFQKLNGVHKNYVHGISPFIVLNQVCVFVLIFLALQGGEPEPEAAAGRVQARQGTAVVRL